MVWTYYPGALLIALDENDMPLYAWSHFLYQYPLTKEVLISHAGQSFPTTTQVGGGQTPLEVPYADAVGSLNMSWQNPSNDEAYITMGARIEWYNLVDEGPILSGTHEIVNPAAASENLGFGDWRNLAFNPPPHDWEAQMGLIWLWSVGPLGEMYIDVHESTVAR